MIPTFDGHDYDRLRLDHFPDISLRAPVEPRNAAREAESSAAFRLATRSLTALLGYPRVRTLCGSQVSTPHDAIRDLCTLIASRCLGFVSVGFVLDEAVKS
jgi:hypothetical protein